MRTRQEVVEALVWMLHEHQCCGDQRLLDDLIKEAQHEGWDLPEELAFGQDLRSPT